jgi:hypothetical protein
MDAFDFKSAVPDNTNVSVNTEQLVYKITAKDEADDRVMLRVLQEMDKSYNAKQTKSLEEVKADMLASSMAFEAVVQEARAKMHEDQERMARELNSMKSQMQVSQKRLFLLEQEKSQMQTNLTGLGADNRQLRKSLDSVRVENVALQNRVDALERRTEVATGSAVVEPLARKTAVSWAALSEEEERISDLERNQQRVAELEKDNRTMASQLDALGTWLQDGAQLFRTGECASAGPTGESEEDAHAAHVAAYEAHAAAYAAASAPHLARQG